MSASSSHKRSSALAGSGPPALSKNDPSGRHSATALRVAKSRGRTTPSEEARGEKSGAVFSCCYWTAFLCSADLFVTANTMNPPLAKATAAPARSSTCPCIPSHSMIARA